MFVLFLGEMSQIIVNYGQMHYYLCVGLYLGLL